MDHSTKSDAKTEKATQIGNYNPWNLLFNSRRRTESENSASSNSNTDQTSTQFGSFQRQASKNNEEYLWMIATLGATDEVGTCCRSSPDELLYSISCNSYG